eukprot:5739092-Amphidinium_carterae.1
MRHDAHRHVNIRKVETNRKIPRQAYARCALHASHFEGPACLYRAFTGYGNGGTQKGSSIDSQITL